MTTKSDYMAMAYKLFDSYDTDNSGLLSTEEFKKCLREMFGEVNKTYSVEEAHLNKIFTICDKNNDGKVSRKELGKAVELFLEPVYIKVKE